jgi:ubiquinone/menaquinone biosynthesis C-methylase UbiE
MTTATHHFASPAERYLDAWHTRNADASRVFRDARDAAGSSSYERLAALARDETSVLDIGCGTGVLLSLIRASTVSTRLTGVDLCLSELRLAQAHLPEVGLHVARAQALPLADGSLDLVLCHMALMLMDQPEQVLAESRRVLRRGGTFSAVTNRPTAPDGIVKTIVGALRPRWERTDTALHPPPIGDRRTFDAETLLPLLSAHFEQVVIDPFAVTQMVPRRELWPYLVNSIYGLDAIPVDDGEEILDSLSLPEPVPWTFAMVQVQGRA